jgi:mitotic spindle assembly checkpoint protein MAD2B
MSTTSPQKPSHTTPADNSLVLADAAQLLTSFTDFLTLALHSLLYHRGLYPARTFLTARAFNLPVQQSRHPGLCTWIRDAVAAVSEQQQQGCVQRVVMVIHAPKTLAVLERWVFDVSSFPEWGVTSVAEPGDAAEAASDEEMEDDMVDDVDVEEAEDDAVNWVDVNEALRGALTRIAYAGESLPNPPEGSTFTLAVELRDDAPTPIGVSFPHRISPTDIIRAIDPPEAPTALDPVPANHPASLQGPFQKRLRVASRYNNPRSLCASRTYVFRMLDRTIKHRSSRKPAVFEKGSEYSIIMTIIPA